MIGSPGLSFSVEPDMAVADMARPRLQVGAGTGPGNTFAAFRQKERAMAGALDQSAGAVEKLMGHPFQRNAAMGAAIEIDIGPCSLTYHHQHLSVVMHRQAAGIRQLVESAQRGGEKIIVVHCAIIAAACRQRQPAGTRRGQPILPREPVRLGRSGRWAS